MKKALAATLLVVVSLFCLYNATAEQSFDELDSEYDLILEKWNRAKAVGEVINNGLPIYPDKGWEDEYAMEAYTSVPLIADREDGKQYAGRPYLITGTLLDIKGYGIDFQLDDGRYAIISFSEYDFETDEFADFGMYPTAKGSRFNIFCTFSSFGYELLSPETYHFTATCTDLARTFCEKRGK